MAALRLDAVHNMLDDFLGDFITKARVLHEDVSQSMHFLELLQSKNKNRNTNWRMKMTIIEEVFTWLNCCANVDFFAKSWPNF